MPYSLRLTGLRKLIGRKKIKKVTQGGILFAINVTTLLPLMGVPGQFGKQYKRESLKSHKRITLGL